MAATQATERIIAQLERIATALEKIQTVYNAEAKLTAAQAIAQGAR